MEYVINIHQMSINENDKKNLSRELYWGFILTYMY